MMTHDTAFRGPLSRRPIVEHQPTIRIVALRDRRVRIRNAAINTLHALALIAALYFVYAITQAVERYTDALEQRAALQVENGELRARIASLQEWTCRDMGYVRDGRQFRWCSKEASK